jgi:carboxyl-terminal processing protease
MLKKQKIAFFSAALLTIVLLVGTARPDLYFLIKKNFTIFSEVYREVAINYVDDVEPEKLMRKGIDSMLESLDPYTVFIDEADKQNIDIVTQGSYGGIGVTVGVRGDKLVVISPTEGYSAHKQGIRAGDVIISIDGIVVENLTPDEVQNLTTGEPGTTVMLTINRLGLDQDLTFELQRERIEVKNIDYSGFIDEEKTIGYISLSRFSQNAAADMQQAFEKLQAQNELKGLVIDLRNNPGGLLSEAVGIVDIFIDAGQKVVEIRGRMEAQNRVFKSSSQALAPSLPVTVLQNNGSASASEIVAGAMQDLDRAVIMGSQSFGKGLVQIVQPLSYNTALKLTTARYYIPSGRSIQSVTYRHDDKNAAVEKPDSLRRAYQTQNGRTVYDGEGITPDMLVGVTKPGMLETALLQQNRIFTFANRYVSENDSYTYDALPGNVFEDFKSFLEQNNFKYKTSAEETLQKVITELEKQDIPSSQTSSHVIGLQKAIDREKAKNFINHAGEIKKMLHLELMSRYGGETARRAASLKVDPLLRQAVQVLKNSDRYNSILSGPG